MNIFKSFLNQETSQGMLWLVQVGFMSGVHGRENP